MERRFRVNTPAVASEIIDDEAVIMNLKSGVYFSTRHVGALLWSWIEQGIPGTVMVQSLQSAFEGSPGNVALAVENFIAELLEHDLIREIPPDAAARLGPPQPPQVSGGGGAGPSRTAFVAPALEVYRDMQDLLLLDPIHDVDDEAGWPRPKPTEESAQ